MLADCRPASRLHLIYLAGSLNLGGDGSRQGARLKFGPGYD